MKYIKKAELPHQKGNSADLYSPVVFRPCFTTGLALSITVLKGIIVPLTKHRYKIFAINKTGTTLETDKNEADFKAWFYSILPDNMVIIVKRSLFPSILGTFELLAIFPHLRAGLDEYKNIDTRYSKITAMIFFMLAAAGVFAKGIYPNNLYPLW